MKSLVVLFWDIARLRKGPAEVPDSVFLIRLLVVLSIAVGLLVGAVSMPWLHSLLWVLVDLAVTVLLLNVVLLIQGNRQRFNQTFIAILGTGILLNLATLPIFLIIAQQPLDASGQLSPGLVLGLLFMAIVVWNVVILGHILSKTLDVGRFTGVVYALLYWWFINILVSFLVP